MHSRLLFTFIMKANNISSDQTAKSRLIRVHIVCNIDCKIHQLSKQMAFVVDDREMVNLLPAIHDKLCLFSHLLMYFVSQYSNNIDPD